MEISFTQPMRVNDTPVLRAVLSVLVKSVVLLAIVVALQLIGTQVGLVSAESDTGERHFFRITMARCDTIVRIDPEVLYFGDSTVFPTPAYADAGFTSDLLASMLPERRIAGFHGLALGPEFFADALEYFVRRGCRPKVVIMPINIRAFSTAFRQDPRHQFGDIRWLLKYDALWFRAFYRPLEASGLCDWRTLSDDAYFDAMLLEAETVPAFGAYRESKGNPLSLDDLRDFDYYGIPVAGDSPCLAGLKRMRETCERIDAEFVCYITPVSYDNIEHWLGVDPADTARANVRFTVDWLNEQRIAFLDLSEAAEPNQFFRKSVPSSHIIRAGRRGVAERLAEHLRGIEW